jgi:hypothetical protein
MRIDTAAGKFRIRDFGIPKKRWSDQLKMAPEQAELRRNP